MPWNNESETPPGDRGTKWPRILRLLMRLGGGLAVIAAALHMERVWRVYAAYHNCPLVEIRKALWRVALGGPLWLALGGFLLIAFSLRRARK